MCLMLYNNKDIIRIMSEAEPLITMEENKSRAEIELN